MKKLHYITHFALSSVSVRPGSTERAVHKYGEASTGRVKPKMGKKPVVSEAPHLSRLAGAKCVYSKVLSPVGDFYMIMQREDGKDVVRASGFGTLDGLRKRLPRELIDSELEETSENNEYKKLVEAYFAGELDALKTILHQQEGSGFYQKVWQTMSEIKPGSVLSYKELAAKSGNPAAVRAAGTACGQNKLILLVPCHRIVRSNGSLGNYLYGSNIKKWLLELIHNPL